MSYTLYRIIPINKLGRRDLRLLDIAIDNAEKSSFGSSLRLGACIQEKGSCIL